MDKIEQYLLEFAKLSEDVTLRKQALDKVLQTSSTAPEEEVRYVCVLLLVSLQLECS